MFETTSTTEYDQTQGRPFPRYCPRCRQKEVRRVIIPYQCQRQQGGGSLTIRVPDLAVPRCSSCGELVFDYRAEEQINAAYQRAIAARPPHSRENGNGSIAPGESGMNQRLAAERLELFEEWVRSFEASALPRSAPDLLASWHQQTQQCRRELEKPRELCIAVLGSAGAGKSTLLNAVLGQRLLPRNDARSCTAAVTRLRYRAGPGFRAAFKHLTTEEWFKEIDAGWEALKDETGDTNPTEVRWEELTGALRDKLCALYGWRGAPPSTISREQLQTLPEPCAALLRGEVTPVEEADPTNFRRRIEQYLSTAGQFWPLITEVEISGAFEALKDGAVLIDLPGLNDVNEARLRITQEYLRHAPCLWIVFTNRGVSKDVKSLLQEQGLLRQLLADGRVGAVTLISTKADDCDEDEAALSGYGLPPDASRLDVINARRRVVENEVRFGENGLRALANKLVRDAASDEAAASEFIQRLDAVPLFIVSASASLALRLRGDRRDYGIPTDADTHVPRLLDQLRLTCEKQEVTSAAHERRTGEAVSLLLQQANNDLLHIELQLQQQAEGTRQRLEQMRTSLTGPHVVLQQDLASALRSTWQGLEERRKAFAEHLHTASAGAAREVAQKATRWRAIDGRSLRAILNKDGGPHDDARGTRYDINVDVADPFQEAMPFTYGDFFGDDLTNGLREMEEQWRTRFEAFFIAVKEVLNSGGLGSAMREALDGTAALIGKRIDTQFQKVLDEVHSTIGETRADLYADMPESVRNSMRPTYQRALSLSPPKDTITKRRLDLLQPAGHQIGATIDTKIRSQLVEGIDGLLQKVRTQFDELRHFVSGQVDKLLARLQSHLPIPKQEREGPLLKELKELQQRLRSI